jgi:RNA polymerase sigma factor (TIGR02999 family)
MDSSHPSPPGEVTRLLARWQEGDQQALEELTPMVYRQLHHLAHYHMRDERSGHLLQTTALVHEAFLRLVGIEAPWQHRQHFYAMAARLMRRVLVDFARRRNAAKRGGGALNVSLTDLDLTPDPADQPEQLLALDEALTRLGRRDPRKLRILELRCFAGMTIQETADLFNVSHTTIENDLRLARAWLSRELHREGRGER